MKLPKHIEVPSLCKDTSEPRTQTCKSLSDDNIRYADHLKMNPSKKVIRLIDITFSSVCEKGKVNKRSKQVFATTAQSPVSKKNMQGKENVFFLSLDNAIPDDPLQYC